MNSLLQPLREGIHRFFNEYRSVMWDQHPNFLFQMQREWAFARQHPSVWAGGVVWYLLGDWTLVTLLGMDLQRANALVLGASIAGLFLFRQWRLGLLSQTS